MDCVAYGGCDRATRPDSTELPSVQVPGLRPTIQRAQPGCPQSRVAAEQCHRVRGVLLRFRRALRDLSEIMLLRSLTVSHECIHRWEAKLLPVMGEASRRRRGIGRRSIFEPSTEAIRKGKASRPTEFGKLAKLRRQRTRVDRAEGRRVGPNLRS